MDMKNMSRRSALKTVVGGAALVVLLLCILSPLWPMTLVPG
jgi:hypothetical protein